jgi:hypothetical protein
MARVINGAQRPIRTPETMQVMMLFFDVELEVERMAAARLL